jgi:hypothetical protein
MSVYNVSNQAIQVVQAGEPETLIVNHSTKNSVILGATSGVGIGTTINDTPLGPYESFAVNGESDVWAIEAALNAPATIYTMQNAVLWTPKQIQADIIDSHSPYTPGIGTGIVNLTPPPLAQGIAIGLTTPSSFTTGIQVLGIQSNLTYASVNPSQTGDQFFEIPILTDVDTTIRLSVTSGTAPNVIIAWIMNPLAVGLVPSGNVGDVNIANVSMPNGNVPVAPGAGTVFFTSPSDSRQMFPNKNVAFAATVNAGATDTIVAAGSNTWLHTFKFEIDPGTNTTANWVLQDTAGTVITNLHFEGVSTTNDPPQAPIDFKGFPLAAGVGVVLKNNSGATSAIFGSLSYSQ